MPLLPFKTESCLCSGTVKMDHVGHQVMSWAGKGSVPSSDMCTVRSNFLSCIPAGSYSSWPLQSSNLVFIRYLHKALVCGYQHKKPQRAKQSCTFCFNESITLPPWLSSLLVSWYGTTQKTKDKNCVVLYCNCCSSLCKHTFLWVVYFLRVLWQVRRTEGMGEASS